MQFIDIPKPGGPEVLTLAEGPIPEPGPEEVLIKVAAAGINHADLSQRKGLYRTPSGASGIAGLEVSGEIIALGKAVKQWSVGDQVCALVNGGLCTVHRRPRHTMPACTKGANAVASRRATGSSFHRLGQRL